MEVRRLKNNELYHFGILGMHWGVRRYQNKDGTLTADGRKRYGVEFDKTRNAKGIKETEAYKKVKEVIDRPQNDDEYDLSEEFNSVAAENNKKLGEFNNKLDELKKEFNKPEVQLKYVKEAVNNHYYDGKFNEKTASQDDLEEYRNDVWFWYNEDGDAGGEGSPFDYFCKSKGIDIYKEAQSLDKEINEKRKEVSIKIVDKALGDIGDIEITNSKFDWNNGKIKDIVSKQLEYDAGGAEAEYNADMASLSRTGFYNSTTDKVYKTYKESEEALQSFAKEKGFLNYYAYLDDKYKKE